MKTLFSEYTPLDPRDQENERDQSKEREEGQEHNRPGTTSNPEEDPRIPTITPETDDGGPAVRGKDGSVDDELIPIKKDEQEDLPGDEEDTDDEEDELDDEEDEMNDEDEDDEDMDSEPGRDTTTNPGDEFSSPANNPRETNFEDPAQNRKTDPMTDHEPRIPGI